MPYPLVGSQRVYFNYANNTHLVWLILEIAPVKFYCGQTIPVSHLGPKIFGGPSLFFLQGGWGSGAWWTLSPQRETLYRIRPLMNFGKVEICLKFEILKKKSFYKGV